MDRIRVALCALFALLFVGGCSDDGNSTCTDHCFSLDIAGENARSVDEKIKAVCEGMGRKGTPLIARRTAAHVAGSCPE